MEHCAQHRRREPQPRRQKTERCALLRGRERNRTAERERDLNELPIYKRCRSPFPGEHATHRTFRGRVAVPTLTSGQQSEVDMDCDTAGSRTPRRGKNIRKSLAIPFVPCPRALSQRGAGKFNYKLMNRKSRRAVESNHRNGQLKETAYATGARHTARRLTTDAGNPIINHQ